MQINGRTILVTGGTSGIGRALAEHFAKRAEHVVIVGRRKGLLDEISAGSANITGLQADLSNLEGVEALAAVVLERFPGLDVLVNNAGISSAEDLTAAAVDLSTPMNILNTNVNCVVHLTNLLLPHLRAQKEATILTTGSGLAFVPRANYPTYCASKAFIHSWLTSLRIQLRDDDVEVLELVPPYVQTALAGSGSVRDPAAMPLDDFIAEVAEIMSGDIPNGEILVDRVKGLRLAERDGNYDHLLGVLNGFA